jgi:eukaryotic-like serine/threonine-protein kinase
MTTVATGTRFGSYNVTGRLGEGGMGEVFRATDSKLKREVAIKVLPAEFTEDRERLARFEREAQLLAQLHHPNIASIFGLEESDGVRALVMELVEGPTLAERLAGGRLPLEECLSIARQIAEALEEAHSKGIVHRDLKPQNVKAPVDGKVKVLDFGLAKAMDPPGSAAAADLGHSPTLMNSPTMTAAQGTRMGVILGTAAYMSPEQARGGAVDKRADIWAFGVVLFEILSGRTLFAAETVSDTLAGVLKTEVDFGALPAATPPALRQLLRRCLERNPKNRLHDIADARLVLDDLIAGRTGDEAREAVAVPARRTATSTAAWVAALLLVGAAAGFAGWQARPRGAGPAEPLRLSIQLAAEQEILVGGNSILAFSPDGGSLVFAGRSGGRQTLFRRDLGGAVAVPIPGTDGADGPFISPDGQWIGFVSGGNLMKVAAEGGRPFRISDWRGSSGAMWLPDGTIVFAPSYSDGLYRGPPREGRPSA